jgi:plasmid stabilization system protein ParE
MMMIKWSNEASDDLVRLHYFLAGKSQRAADEAIRRIIAGSLALENYARRGQIMEKYLPREVRRLLVADYELRYEIQEDAVYVVPVFHMREER